MGYCENNDLDACIGDQCILDDIQVKSINICESRCSEIDDFCEWLIDDVRLSEYSTHFCLDGFDDMRVLQYVTDDILAEMGVSKKGHRILLLQSIAKLSLPSHYADPHKKDKYLAN